MWSPPRLRRTRAYHEPYPMVWTRGSGNNEGNNEDSWRHCVLPNLIGHAWRLYKEDKSLDLIDASFGNSYSVSEVLRSIHIGLLCVQQLAEDRPSAPQVVSMLGGESSLASPKRPGFFIQGSETVSTIVSSSRSSVNGVTLTQTEGI